jgi:hypothetical protein
LPNRVVHCVVRYCLGGQVASLRPIGIRTAFEGWRLSRRGGPAKLCTHSRGVICSKIRHVVGPANVLPWPSAAEFELAAAPKDYTSEFVAVQMHPHMQGTLDKIHFRHPCDS